MSRSASRLRRARAPYGAALAAALLITAIALTGAALHAPEGSAAPELDPEEAAFLDLINAYRAANGRGALAVHPQLTAAADWHAADMALCGYLSHTDSLGRGPQMRVAAFGYTRGVGENAARGGIFPTAETVFNAWKGSPGHNANMLGSLYNVIGIGRSYKNGVWTWTTDFGNSSTLNSPPSDTGPGPGEGCDAATPTPAPAGTTPATAAPTADPTATPEPTPTPTPTPEPTPTLEPTPRLVPGDADCDGLVESEDALYVLRESAGYGVEAGCLAGADVNCDGERDARDALGIMRWVISLPVSAPEGCPPIGV